MNKKQLIVSWVTLGIIVLIIVFAPTYRVVPFQGKYIRITKINPDYDHITPQVNWDKVLQYCIPTLITSVLLIYTLRDKKK